MRSRPPNAFWAHIRHAFKRSELPYAFYLLDNCTILQPEWILEKWEEYKEWESQEMSNEKFFTHVYGDDVCIFTARPAEIRWIGYLAGALGDKGDNAKKPRNLAQHTPRPYRRLQEFLERGPTDGEKYYWWGIAWNKTRFEELWKYWAKHFANACQKGRRGQMLPYNVVARAFARIAIIQWFEHHITMPLDKLLVMWIRSRDNDGTSRFRATVDFAMRESGVHFINMIIDSANDAVMVSTLYRGVVEKFKFFSMRTYAHARPNNGNSL